MSGDFDLFSSTRLRDLFEKVRSTSTTHVWPYTPVTSPSYPFGTVLENKFGKKLMVVGRDGTFVAGLALEPAGTLLQYVIPDEELSDWTPVD